MILLSAGRPSVRPLATAARNPAFVTAAALLAGIGLLLWTPSEQSSGTVCFVRTCTGTSCPGCGLTRAVAYLLRGDLGSMWVMHPLAPLFVADVIAAVVLMWLVRLGRLRLRPRYVSVWVGVHLPVLLGVWMVRGLVGTLPT